MKVLSLLWGFSLGGIGKYAITLDSLNDFPELIFETACICGNNWDCDLSPLTKINAKLIHIRSRLDFSWISRCCKLIEASPSTLVFVHGFNGPVIAKLLQSRMNREFPFVCSYHGMYHPPRLLRTPLAAVFNRSAEYIYRHKALGVLAVAEHCKKYLIQRAVTPGKIETIHNGIPALQPTFEKSRRPEIGLDYDDFVIGTSFRLDPVKGIEYLIDAFANLRKSFPKAKLVLAGSGPSLKKLMAQRQRLNLDEAVVFTGYQSDLGSRMNIFDIFALPSLSECHSIALLEAMRAGLPIVATNVGGNPESIRDGKEGILVPPRDSKALEMAIGELISKPYLRASLGEAAKRRFEENFTTATMLERTASWLLSFKDKVESKI